MSYGVGIDCEGLGQTPAEVDGARRILIGMIQSESNRIAGLADTPPVAAIRRKISEAVQWARAAAWRQQEGKLADALESASVGVRTMHDVSRAITGLSSYDRQAAQAQQQTQTGASFVDQLAVALGLKTPEEVYRPDVPGGAVADVVGGAVGGTARAIGTAGGALVGGIASYPWLIPAAAGIVLFFALRK